ncbi:hypothetical protein FRC12_002483 [Ceratobasidium sp. 428]|nr:hypothetical protein FRC12_002483 [Ceratobasidium sp. 428]
MRSTPLFTFLLTLLFLLSFSLASPAPAPLVPDAPALVERAPGDNSTEVDPVTTSGGGSSNRGGKSTPCGCKDPGQYCPVRGPCCGYHLCCKKGYNKSRGIYCDKNKPWW